MSRSDPSGPPFSGSLGCRASATVVIEHPDHGERVACPGCAEGYEVVRNV